MDDLLLEVRKAREAYAREFNFDLQAIHRDLKAAEKLGGRKVVSLSRRRPFFANLTDAPALPAEQNGSLDSNGK